MEPRALPRRQRVDAKPTVAVAQGSQPLNSLHAQLRLQSVDIDRLEAENEEQRAIEKSLRQELGRLKEGHESDTQDLVLVAGKLLALSRFSGAELDLSTKELFRRRGWSSSARRGQQP